MNLTFPLTIRNLYGLILFLLLQSNTVAIGHTQRAVVNNMAQQNLEKITVKGQVLDADTQETLIGVNITVKGKTEGTATDIDGKFNLMAEQGNTLLFSYIGYITKEIKVNNEDLGIIYLESDAKQLEEVVVVGYGTQRRSDLTGSLSSISDKELKALPATGLDQALQGRAAGVFVTQNSGAPDGGVSIQIRGIGSTYKLNKKHKIFLKKL